MLEEILASVCVCVCVYGDMSNSREEVPPMSFQFSLTIIPFKKNVFFLFEDGTKKALKSRSMTIHFAAFY